MNLRAAVVALLLLAAVPALALAQNVPLYQTGKMITGDAVKAATNGLVRDAGGLLGDANGKGLNPFAVTDSLGLGICSNSAATGGAYSALCIGHDASGNGLIGGVRQFLMLLGIR